MQTSPSPDFPAEALGVVAAFMGIWLLAILAFLVITVIAYWKIFSKAGFSGALSLLMLVPIANFVMLLVLAFSEWPLEREVALLRSASSRQPVATVPPAAPPAPQYPQQM